MRPTTAHPSSPRRPNPPATPRSPNLLLDEPDPVAEAEREGRVFRVALVAAAAVHLGLAFVVLPEASVVEATPEQPRVIELAPTPRFEPPEPPPEPQPPSPRTTRDTIPVPNAPPEPVPVPETEPTLPPVPFDDTAPIPSSPPTGLHVAEPTAPSGPLRLGGDITPPVRLRFVEPRFPSIAKHAQVGGIVRLEAVIDTDGRVIDVKVLVGLPLGLTEAAIDAVEQWRYEPARLDERPVAVYLNVQVEFAVGGS